MSDPVKVYESGRSCMYEAMETNNAQRAKLLYQNARDKFTSFLQDCSKSYGMYSDLVWFAVLAFVLRIICAFLRLCTYYTCLIINH